MAKGIMTASLSGLTELINSVKAIPKVVDKAIEAGATAMMEQGKKNLQQSYVSAGGTVGDYVYRSIDYYGTDKPTGVLPDTSYWTSVGVFKIDSIYNAYNAEKKANQKGEIKKEAMTAAQIAYWMENGVSRLYLDGRLTKKGKKFDPNAVSDPMKLISVQPKPFISNAFTTGWNSQYNAFSVAFNNKIQELS